MSYPDEPTLAPIAERLRERTQPLAPNDEEYGYAHAYLCEVGEVFDPDGDIPPMAPLLDPDLCPDWALGWLAQMVGVALPAGVSPADARTIIRKVSGFQRGTRAALAAAAGLYLTGGKTVYFRERDQTAADPPYSLQIVTLVSETPDPAATLAAILRQKPGGIVLDYHTIVGWDYLQMSASYATYAALPPKFATYSDLRDNHPTG
jgi:hypothetical protein